MSQSLSLTATQTQSVIMATIAQTSQTISTTHSQVTIESSEVVPSSSAHVLPTTPLQAGTSNTMPSSNASSNLQQQQTVTVSQPPPLATIQVPVTVSVAPTIVAALIQLVLVSEPVGQLEDKQLRVLIQMLTTLNLSFHRAPWHLALLLLPHHRTLRFWHLTPKGERVRECEIEGEL